MAAFEHEVRKAYVFAASTGRRARALQVAGLCVAVVSLAWIAALAVALLGAGALPDALPAAKARAAPQPVPARAPARRIPGSAPRRARVAVRDEVRTSAATVRPARATAPAALTVTSPRASVTAPGAPPPPASPRQGWARRGWTAPPGQVKPDRTPPRGANGHGAAAGDPSGTTPGQSGSHAHNG
jgi:hypothetical protein